MAEKEITIDNIRIPAGVVVDVPTWGMAHDEEFWEDPFEFKPERWASTFCPENPGFWNVLGERLGKQIFDLLKKLEQSI